MIAGRYRLGHVIGRGGMGAVVAGQHIALDDRVAVKFLNPELAGDLESIERFVREAKAAARIKSPHVVRVLDVGATPEGQHYIVMDLLDGRDLEKVVAEGPLPIALAADCVLQAADALAEAHAVGIVHRDIKPANLWLSTERDGSPHVRVLDFGISKLAPTTSNALGITDTQSVFGSPTYMSPEQIRSAKHVDPRTDVWALGVVCYELVTGHLPFVADNVAGVIAAISSDPPVPVRVHRPDVPPEVERIILACLEKDPSRRATLRDLAQALTPFVSAAGRSSAERIGRASPDRRSVRPSRPSLPAQPSLPARSEAELIGISTTQGAFDTSSNMVSRRVSWTIAGATMSVALLAFAIFLAARRGGGPPATAPAGAPPASAQPPAIVTTATTATTAMTVERPPNVVGSSSPPASAAWPPPYAAPSSAPAPVGSNRHAPPRPARAAPKSAAGTTEPKPVASSELPLSEGRQ